LLRNLFRRQRAERDLDAEVRAHLDLLIAEKIQQGLPPADASRAARIELGGLEQVKEEVRAVRSGAWLDAFWRDLRYAFRGLGRDPGFAAVAMLTLALGIGATTAIFSILESQLWRPLPFPDSERLMNVHVVLRENPRQWDVLSAGPYLEWRGGARSFTSLAAYNYPGARNLTANGTAERVMVMPVSSNFFDTLEVPLALGRGFMREEETPGRGHEAIVSDALWRNRFASDPELLGKSITLDGETYSVIGIASPRLRLEYIEEPDLFVPVSLDPSATVVARNLYTVGRLAPGVTSQQAREELALYFVRLPKSQRRLPEDTAAVKNLRETWTDFAARPLYFFAGAVALVLLIACVNTAGLLLARGLSRQREYAVRAALGAGRGVLARQSLVESLLLALGGGAAGAMLGFWLASSFGVFFPEGALPRRVPTEMDGRVLLFALVVSIVSALLVGLLPARLASRADLNQAMRLGARGGAAGVEQRRTRSSLVAVEVALGLVLLFGTGLFLSSFFYLRFEPRGFEAPGAMTFRVALRGEHYAKPGEMERYFQRLTEEIGALPGVRTVTFGSGLPLTGSENLFANVNIAGRPPLGPHGRFVVIHSVRDNYFQALRMHLLAGRAFDPHDTETSARVAVINRNAANDLFGTEDPLGKVLEFVPDENRGVPAEDPVEIVGVTENAQEFNADEVPFETLYLPFPQHSVTSAYVLAATDLPRGTLAAGIRAAAYKLDKDQPVFDLKTMDDRIEDSLHGALFNMFLVGSLAVVAVLLVSVGIFGMVAYFVQQRTQEFGIRLALGASPAVILRHAIAQSLRIGAAGVCLGTCASLILGRLLRHALYLAPHEHTGMLHGVSIYDPLTLSSAGVLMIAVLLAASYLPARRAMRVDPMTALRNE
jgi:putative ABC transport system permease protein